MEQNNKTWFDALLKREDCREILTAYITNNIFNSNRHIEISSFNLLMHEELGPLLEIHYTSSRRQDPEEKLQDPIYWSEHSLYRVDRNGKLVNELTINTIAQPIITDIYNILLKANEGITINGLTYEAEHKTYCKKELAHQYVERIKKLREEEKMLIESYNSAVENFSDTLRSVKTEFRHNKSKNYPTM